MRHPAATPCCQRQTWKDTCKEKHAVVTSRTGRTSNLQLVGADSAALNGLLSMVYL